ncbi:hypothetical protein G7K_6669-t1 [Saitoella complicata NRRL Y-17804]|uniref:Uncharacterized protein n=1 Tax=Saitoella complicata (strain BCRC 22490 / CBS 7301 / JCM 7358 / NBRC 10748 / NRRL Y-17804) TaxID=698492 RepID=A0A0E9NSF8_SAICN|nr:hypothetical protein G7K_6669-t1 [Saitoella complicata NRRL Y-17804]
MAARLHVRTIYEAVFLYTSSVNGLVLLGMTAMNTEEPRLCHMTPAETHTVRAHVDDVIRIRSIHVAAMKERIGWFTGRVPCGRPTRNSVEIMGGWTRESVLPVVLVVSEWLQLSPIILLINSLNMFYNHGGRNVLNTASISGQRSAVGKNQAMIYQFVSLSHSARHHQE